MRSRILFTFLGVLVSFGFAAAGNVRAQSAFANFNEKLTIRSAQTIAAAQATFIATTGAGDRYGTFAELSAAQLIDPILASGEKYGYLFSLTAIPASPGHAARFQVSAVPRHYPKTGKRSFYLDESGVLRGADRQGAPATADDPFIPLVCGESGAISVMRTLAAAEFTYAATIGAGNYGDFFDLYQAGLINAYLADAENCGYVFRVATTMFSETNPATFKFWARPQNYPATGIRSFYIDQSGVLRGADHGGGEAAWDDPPVED
jgi:hypothetical protein